MNVLSLFSGCGGMDIGFEGGFKCLKKSINMQLHPEWVQQDDGDYVVVNRTGFDTIFANDIRPDAKAAWVNYFNNHGKADANSIYHLDSIVDLVKRARNGENVFPTDVDVVTGGFPCQDFSIAGKRLGFDSAKSHRGVLREVDQPSEQSRGKLYMWMRQVVSLTSPKLFIAENVKGLTNLGDVKAIIQHDFSQAGNGGYLVVPAHVLYAANYGVPQSRQRVIFFGFKKSALKTDAITALSCDVIPEAYDPYPPNTHSVDASGGLPKYTSCSDAFINLEQPETAADPAQKAYSRAKFMGKHCQGQTEIKLNSVGPTIRSEHHGNIEFRRLSQEHSGEHTQELQNGFQERRLTVRECARIQTFPDDYEFIIPSTAQNVKVSSSDAYKIIGNAVPCVMAYNIAQNISTKWALYFKE